jgi:hypothetical protein
MRFTPASLRWWASLALLLPVIVLYASEYLGATGSSFTGFIQYDQPYYMANARNIFEGGFHFFYGNPFSPDPDTPRIYFQVHLWVLGLVQAVTGCDPGLLYVIFGFVAALICVRTAMALYEQVAGLETSAQWMGLVLFLWGGGLLAFAGLVFHLAQPSDFHTTVTDLFCFDPAQGWWFLNLGRNLVLPTEAYYHALVFGAALLALRNHFRAALWLLFMLSLSHPFTGLQFLLIFLGWSLWEKAWLGNKTIPFAFPALLFCLLIFHVVYNVFLLNLFPEHRAVFQQWSVAWGEQATAFFPAYLLVAWLALLAMRSRSRAVQLFSKPANRLLLVWFLVSCVLVHHDLLITPRQPLHFSRGYIWIPLFLLGIQPLLELLETFWHFKSRWMRATTLALILLVGLSDNLAWFGLHTTMALAPRLGIPWMKGDGFRLSDSDRQLYQWLQARPGSHSELLVTPGVDQPLIYLATVYTGYRGWYSHYAMTPFASQHRSDIIQFFEVNTTPPEWGRRSLLIINRKDAIPSVSASKPAYENKAYFVHMLLPVDSKSP